MNSKRKTAAEKDTRKSPEEREDFSPKLLENERKETIKDSNLAEEPLSKFEEVVQEADTQDSKEEEANLASLSKQKEDDLSISGADDDSGDEIVQENIVLEAAPKSEGEDGNHDSYNASDSDELDYNESFSESEEALSETKFQILTSENAEELSKNEAVEKASNSSESLENLTEEAFLNDEEEISESSSTTFSEELIDTEKIEFIIKSHDSEEDISSTTTSREELYEKSENNSIISVEAGMSNDSESDVIYVNEPHSTTESRSLNIKETSEEIVSTEKSESSPASTSEYDEDQLKKKLGDWFSVHFQTHDARLHKLEELLASQENSGDGLMSKLKKVLGIAK